MEHNKAAAAIVQWRGRFLEQSSFHEEDYERALQQAQVLEQAGVISTREWIDLVRQANQALLEMR